MAKPSPKKRYKKRSKKGPSRLPLALILVIAAVALILAGKALLKQDGINPADPAEVQLDQALEQNRVIYALFHSTTCIPCKEMEKTAAAVMPEFKGKVTFIDVNVYESVNTNLLRRMGLRVIPTNYIFDRSGQSKKVEGAIPADSLRSELNAALAK
jgi:thiol:disulfide interchange protein